MAKGDGSAKGDPSNGKCNLKEDSSCVCKGKRAVRDYEVRLKG